MKISVVIPVYNEERYIGACLDSLLNQSVSPDEILVVNNNSTDNTVKIAKKYNVRLLHEKKQGITYARNKGFNYAKYDIIARTDADTILPPDWLEKIKKKMARRKTVAVTGPAEFNDLPKIINNSRFKTKRTFIKMILAYNRVVKKILKHDCIYGPNVAIKKDAWKKVRSTVCLDDNQVHEDLDLAIHLAPLGDIKFSRELVVKTSVRRWKKPDAYIEYLYRGLKSINKHGGIQAKEKSRQIVKNFSRNFSEIFYPQD